MQASFGGLWMLAAIESLRRTPQLSADQPAEFADPGPPSSHRERSDLPAAVQNGMPSAPTGS